MWETIGSGLAGASGGGTALWTVIIWITLALVVIGVLSLITLVVIRGQKDHHALLQAQRALRSSAEKEAMYKAVAENANDGLVYQDMHARILWANPTYCRTMGWELSEILGRRPQEFCFPPEARPSDDEIRYFRFDPSSVHFRELHRMPNMRKNGERFWQEFSQAVVSNKPGRERVVLVSRDVTQQVRREQELEKARENLQFAARHDPLTGLANRIAFLEDADALLARQERTAGHVGLISIDIDQLKAINDTHGQAAGDAILCHVAEALKRDLKSGDLACRLGGDEFAVVCNGVSDFDTLQLYADALLERLQGPITWQDAPLQCGASMGLVIGDARTARADDLLRTADFALLEAKRPGTQRIARYDADLHARQEAENTLLQAFSDTLDDRGISFLYQPVLDATTGGITSFEALARWVRPDGSVLTPDRFLGYATRLNRLADVDFAALRATTDLVASLRGRGHRVRGAFNTSSQALAHPAFLSQLSDHVAAAGLMPQDVTIEVLETTFFGPDTTNSLAAERISQLRSLGYSVFLDDFGVGYAGLAHLGQLDISGIKLDRTLVANVAEDRSSRIIVTAILRLCEELGIKALAEGIETEAQADFVVAHGCTLLQGFGIARPLNREALIAKIEADGPIDIQGRPFELSRSA
jgi:diguanylate cyclase (GGDEF)-like protein/PAS domain S-box-containing protein